MALDAVVVKFAVAGIPEVSSAFQTVAKASEKFEQQTTKATERGGRARVNEAEREARAREKAAQKVARESERLEKQRTKDTEREARKREDAEKRSVQRAATEEQRAAKATAREIERIEEQKMRVRIRSSEMAGRLAAKQAAEEIRAAERSRAHIRGAAGRGAGNALGMVKGAFGMAAGGLSLMGGFELANVSRKEMEAERTAALLANVVTPAGQKAPRSVAQLMGTAGAVSKETGMAREDVLAGMLRYSQTARGGDIAGVEQNIGFFTKLAQTTGTDLTEVAQSAGILQSQNQGLDAGGMQQMLLDVYAQGKAGSMSMVDVAKQIGVLAAPATSFGGNQATNQRTLLALGQLAAPQGSIEEAGTFVKDLVSEAGSHRKSTQKTRGLEDMGVKFDKYGRMESPEQMIEKVLQGTGGDITKIEEIFGKRGTAVFRALQKPFADAGGGEKGLAAVRATMQGVTSATMTTGDLEAQHKVLMETPAEKFSVAVNKIEETLRDALEPRLSAFADKVGSPEFLAKIDSIINGAGELAKFFAENPFKTIGTIVLAAIMKDIAVAAIGEAIKGQLLKLLGGGAAGGLPGGGGGGVAGKVLAGAAIAGVAVMAAETGISAIDQMNASSREASGKQTMSLAQAAVDARQRGPMSPAKLKELEARAQALGKVSEEKAAAAAAGPGVLAKVTGMSREVQADQVAQAKLAKEAFEQMTKAVLDAKKALELMGRDGHGIPAVTSGAPTKPIGAGARS